MSGRFCVLGLRPLLAVQLLILKVKYTYQKLNIHKSKLLNCNINIKNPNQNQTFSNLPPALLQSKTICIFAHSEQYPFGLRPRGHPYPHIIYMAQSKSFFGLRRGSTKTLTFSVYNGKQVTKDRVYNVKNPRSAMQMKQRAIMATALRGYSALQEICDHSFEGITYGQKSMNYFVSENARMIRSAAPNVNLSLSKGNSVSNAYIISKGSLPSVLVEVNTEGNNKFTVSMNIPVSGFTFGTFMAQLGATQVGDMATFVMLCDNQGANASIYWMRLKLTEENKSKSINTTSDIDIISVLTEGKDFDTNIDNFSVGDFAIKINKENGFVIVEEVNTSGPRSLGVVLSRKTDTGWLRSPSTMVNITETYNYAEALASYPESGEKILNGGNV